MTRDLVLSILKTRKGYVSGELISKELGLTRAAVNLAVKALRKDGYVILSSTKLGYMLKSAPDRLTSGELLTVLGPERMRTVSVKERTRIRRGPCTSLSSSATNTA